MYGLSKNACSVRRAISAGARPRTFPEETQRSWVESWEAGGGGAGWRRRAEHVWRSHHLPASPTSELRPCWSGDGQDKIGSCNAVQMLRLRRVPREGTPFKLGLSKPRTGSVDGDIGETKDMLPVAAEGQGAGRLRKWGKQERTSLSHARAKRRQKWVVTGAQQLAVFDEQTMSPKRREWSRDPGSAREIRRMHHITIQLVGNWQENNSGSWLGCRDSSAHHAGIRIPHVESSQDIAGTLPRHCGSTNSEKATPEQASARQPGKKIKDSMGIPIPLK